MLPAPPHAVHQGRLGSALQSSPSLNDQSSVVATVSRWRRAVETYIEAMPYSSNVCPPSRKQTFMSGGGRTALSPPQKHFRVETCHKSAMDASRFGRSANHYLGITPRRGVFPLYSSTLLHLLSPSAGAKSAQKTDAGHG